MNRTRYLPNSLPPASRILHPRFGFTLVELLVVIAIIGILVALITVAAAGALKRARQAQIKVELDQISMAFETYKDKYGSYPSNCQTDGVSAAAVLNAQQVLANLKRHLKQAFPRHRESNSLLEVLTGLSATGTDSGDYTVLLDGGMTAGEAMVFWLGGFSSDPRYPISGEGGPSYLIDNLPAGVAANEADPIESRNWIMPLAIDRLGPRNDDNYFDQSTDRFIEYTVNGETRRINFWQYVPAKSEQPYLYFDTSRHAPEVRFDPPAATMLTGLGPNGDGLHVHAIKKISDVLTPGTLPIQYVNPEKFQILHAGVDDEWGEEAFELMSAHGVSESPDGLDPLDSNSYLLYPTGPFTGEVADTIVNFSDATLEDSQQ